MQEWIAFAVTLTATSIALSSAKSELRPDNMTTALSCSPGFVPQGNSCVCGKWPNGIIICDEDSRSASMQIGYCMTYGNETGEVRAGACQQSYFRNDSYKFYYSLPSEAFDLDDRVCGPSNSRGLLCGECRDGFTASPPLDINCINCTGASHGWIKAITISFLPVTLIFCVTITLAISIVSGPVNSVIFFGQITASSYYNVGFIASVLGAQGTFTYSNRKSTTILAAIYDSMNLNFFKSLVSPYCLPIHLTRLQSNALHIATAFYPLILIVFLYVCIQLHFRNFRPIVYCWQPFLKCFLHIRRSVDPNTSIIDAFATFILLSYVKLMYVVGYFFIPSYVYNSYGHKVSTLVLYYSTNVQFFHKEHLPFVVPSIFILLIFVALPPIVLIFYPTSFFKKCLSQCKMNSEALRTFVEAFQGCYKDGTTNGTRDCRYFSGIYFVLRIIIVLLSLANIHVFVLASSLLYWCTALVFVCVKPYHCEIYNFIDATILGLMGTIYSFISFDIAYVSYTGRSSASLLMLIDMLYALPLLYLVLFVVWWVLNRKLKAHNCLRQQSKKNDYDADIPDRLQHPENYEALTEESKLVYREPLSSKRSRYTYGNI